MKLVAGQTYSTHPLLPVQAQQAVQVVRQVQVQHRVQARVRA